MKRSREGLVSKVTDNGLDGLSSIPGRGKEFFSHRHHVDTASVSPKLKLPEHEPDYTFSTEV
jgi:hypothetical protein